jgi:protein-disulfide isomerase
MNGDYAADVARSGKNLGISRQVYGTPTYFINGVKATQLNEDTTLQQWIQVIDGLLSANKQ